MPPLTLHRLTDSTDPRFTPLLDLYTAAFPPEERKSAAELRTMLRRSDYRFLLAQQNDEVLGLAVLFCSETTAIALLEYLAVRPEARGRGIGRWLFGQVVAATDTTQRPLLIEAESDRATTAGQLERRRRKQFYRSLGAREITGLRYLMPQVSTAPPPPLELMLHAQPAPATVSRDDLQRWLQTLYTEVYHQTSEDPRLHQMLEPLPLEVPLI